MKKSGKKPPGTAVDTPLRRNCRRKRAIQAVERTDEPENSTKRSKSTKRPNSWRGRSIQAEDSAGSSRSRAAKKIKKSEEEEEEEVELELEDMEEEEEEEAGEGVSERSNFGAGSSRSRSTKTRKKSEVVEEEEEEEEDDESIQFVGEPMPEEEAKARWPFRYNKVKNDGGESSNGNGNGNGNGKGKGKGKGKDKNPPPRLALRHYTKAVVDGDEYKLYDDVEVQAEENKTNYIAKIVELFEGTNKKKYFTARWYYRHVDTVIKERVHEELKDSFDDRRVFFSDITDENPLGCLVKPLRIIQVSPLINSSEIPGDSNYYCDMGHSLSYSTISKLPEGFLNRPIMSNPPSSSASRDSSSTISSETSCNGENEKSPLNSKNKKTLNLLDLYAGCGGMSTGLCYGAAIGGVDIVSKWAVDLNSFACESLKFNHPNSKVRNETAEDFLMLLKEWKKLSMEYCSVNEDDDVDFNSKTEKLEIDSIENNDEESEELSDDEFEVQSFVDICFGDPNGMGEKGFFLKVQWKGYDSSYDSWEPINNFSNCQERMKEFVVEGCKANILPLPGDVDIICGGPPCQGVSGYNRFRDTENPLKDEKNAQLTVFMNIVEYLKPKYVLMENVTDILKFVDGYLGRYAIGRLISMKYQTRLGIMAAGSFGLPQCRMRAFFWGACPSQILPQFPWPTHAVRNLSSPSNYSDILVDGKQCPQKLKAALVLEDVLSDLPAIKNDEARDEMPYEGPPQTEFQKQIRLRKDEGSKKGVLYDHRPLNLNKDDYARVCQVPKKKGANFRDFPGVLVDKNNVVYFDPTMERVLLPSGKPLVPDYAMTYVKGKSAKPFGRLWHDEIVNTVVTRAEPHNQRIIHPTQDRVLSIRENARIQGFPDCYKLFGPVKERYIQVGNAVAVPVARALGYSLAIAVKGEASDKPLLLLPPEFPNSSSRRRHGKSVEIREK